MFPLHPQAHVAVVGPDLVVLQVDRDRYLCLPGAAELARLSEAGGAIATADDTLRLRLREAGVLGDDDPPTRRRPPPLPVIGQPGPAARVGGRDRLRLAMSAADGLAGYAGQPLAAVIAYGERREPVDAGAGDDEEVGRLAAVFQAAAPWLPIPGKCLMRSFVLRRFLRRSGVDADWVFGVRTWPFSAHCWLQAGDRALDDHAERLEAYTPILVV